MNRVRDCQCADCRGTAEHPNKQLHHQMNLFLSRLDEQQRRWYVALESKKGGPGGDAYMLVEFTPRRIETLNFKRNIAPPPYGLATANLARRGDVWVVDDTK